MDTTPCHMGTGAPAKRVDNTPYRMHIDDLTNREDLGSDADLTLKHEEHPDNDRGVRVWVDTSTGEAFIERRKHDLEKDSPSESLWYLSETYDANDPTNPALTAPGPLAHHFERRD